MKNLQIHQQEKMIMELEKQVEKNLKLEEKITMLQHQNEELRARIEQNTVITRFVLVFAIYMSLKGVSRS